jgi:hypothetical protein
MVCLIVGLATNAQIFPLLCPCFKKPLKIVKAIWCLSRRAVFHGGGAGPYEKGEEDCRRLPALRVGHPPNGRKAVLGGGPPAGRIRVGHGRAG